MVDKVKITTLIEDTAIGYDLFAEHGISFWIEYADKNILFDTGQSGNVARNAEILDIDLSKADAIVISHGHYDHTGGLDAVLSIAKHAKIYMHPGAVGQKFGPGVAGLTGPIGMPNNISSVIDAHSEENKVIRTAEPMEIFPGLFVTGQVPRIEKSSSESGEFFLDANGHEPDEVEDDQSLFFKTEKGIVVVFGCAHAGVVNILRYIEKVSQDDNFYAVMGGMHLINMSEDLITRAVEVFAEYGIEKIGTAHCTGLEAAIKLRDAFPRKCFMCSVGANIEF